MSNPNGRPQSIPGGRDFCISVRVSEAEYDEITELARRYSVSRGAIMRTPLHPVLRRLIPSALGRGD